jgi:long-chain fatty acid transport protein
MRRSLPAALVILLAPTVARGAGYYITDIGTQGLARAGAFVASPDSLLAMHYNPAGLSQLSGLHFEVDLSLVQLSAAFQRACPCVDPGLSGAGMLDQALSEAFASHPQSTNTPLAIPFIGIAYGFPVADLTIGFAVYGPNAGKFKWGPDLKDSANNPSFSQIAKSYPGRYSAQEATTLDANFQLTAALQPISGLRVGGSAIVYQNGNTQLLDLWVNPAFAPQPEQTDFDVPLNITFKRNFALNWNLGASYDILPGLTLGASFRGKRSIRAEGTIDQTLPKLLRDLGAVTNGNRMEIELNTPPIARAGLQYAIPHLFKAEAAFVYEGWSVYDQIVIRPKDITVQIRANDTPQMLSRIVQPRGWQNTYSIRVGGEVNVLEPLVGFRAGYFFEPSAIPPDRVDISRVDLNKHGFGLGASTTFLGFTLQIAAMYVILQTEEVHDSKVKITSTLQPPIGSDALLTTIGNGTYSGSYFIGSASLSFALDPLLSR